MSAFLTDLIIVSFWFNNKEKNDEFHGNNANIFLSFLGKRKNEVMISLCLMDGGRMSFLSANFHCRGGVGVIHFFLACSGFYLIR
jgi:hypothetical protein